MTFKFINYFDVTIYTELNDVLFAICDVLIMYDRYYDVINKMSCLFEYIQMFIEKCTRRVSYP